MYNCNFDAKNDIPEFLDSEHWTLNAGLWMLDFEHWTLDSGHWTLDPGHYI